MTTTQVQELYNVTAGQDLTPDSCLFHAVSLAGLIVANTSRVAGVLVTKGLSGEQVSYVRTGVTKVMAGAAVTTLGYPLVITTSGWFIAASSGGAMVGRALTAAASGDLLSAEVDFNTIPAWPGV
jgi:hypothetical protein